MAEEIKVAALKDLPQVIKKALYHDGLARGLNECVKALDRGVGRLCIFAQDCEEASYTKLIKALCAEHKVPLIIVEKRSNLGEWCGLCKYDAEQAPHRVVNTSCCVITEFGEETPEVHRVLEFANTN